MSLRVPEAATLAGVEPAAPPIAIIDLCAECGLRSRAAGGRLTRCLACIKAAAQEDRLARQAAEAALAAKQAEVPAKCCRTCKISKPLSSFGKHRLSKDGRRYDCAKCVKAERVKRAQFTEQQRIADVARRAKPHRRAANRQAVRSWTARNQMAARARRLLRRALKAGKVQIAEHCQARDCTSARRLEGHHHDYARPYVVTWLCARHHRRAHSSGVLHLDESLPRRRARIPRLN